MDIHISLDVKRHHYNKRLFYIQHPANQPAVIENFSRWNRKDLFYRTFIVSLPHADYCFLSINLLSCCPTKKLKSLSWPCRLTACQPVSKQSLPFDIWIKFYFIHHGLLYMSWRTLYFAWSKTFYSTNN